MSTLIHWPMAMKHMKKPQQVMSESWEDRTKILDANTNLFCWKRHMVPIAKAYLEQQLREHPLPIRIAVDRRYLWRQLKEARAVWDSKPTEQSDAFWADLARLADDFLLFSQDGSGTLHLRVIQDDACTKFHTDGYRLRLFTTYSGPGTEWLPEDAVNRSGLGKSNERIVKHPDRIQKMGAYEVGILKGEPPLSDQPVKGIVHRSPQISKLGCKRIILRIDIP